MHPHVQVPGGTAALARGALALELDPLPVGHPGRNPRLDGPRAGRVTAAVARLARVLDHQPPAPAGLARFREGEVAEVPAGLPGAFTGRADLGHGAGLGTGAVTDRAGPVAGQLERNRGPVHRIAERQGGLGLHVGAAAGAGLGSSPAPTPEHAAEDVPEPSAAGGPAAGLATPEEVAEVEPEPAARLARTAGPGSP